MANPPITLQSLPENPALQELARGLKLAHDAYGVEECVRPLSSMSSFALESSHCMLSISCWKTFLMAVRRYCLSCKIQRGMPSTNVLSSGSYCKCEFDVNCSTRNIPLFRSMRSDTTLYHSS